MYCFWGEGCRYFFKKCLYNDASEELASEYYAFKNTPQKEEEEETNDKRKTRRYPQVNEVASLKLSTITTTDHNG